MFGFDVTQHHGIHNYADIKLYANTLMVANKHQKTK